MLELALHVLDIGENAIRAGATHLDIDIREDMASDMVSIDIVDNGSGMDPVLRSRALDPFFTTKPDRRIGLGLSLLAQSAEAAGGTVHITEAASGGTRVTATFRLHHPDRQPIGDLGGVIAMLLSRSSMLDIRLSYTGINSSFVFDSAKLRTELGGLWIEHPAVLTYIRDSIRAGIDRASVHTT
ncbi:MAG: sensor histidine kinase [Desulfobacterota bacterium]|nr:sensor histidine kinase [Thermodesulfobacteriota bacterium]